jgi:hypothetical protein
MGLFRREENISFMNCFKVLIKDLEEEYKANRKKSTSEIVREANNSLLPPRRDYLSTLRKPKKPTT